MFRAGVAFAKQDNGTFYQIGQEGCFRYIAFALGNLPITGGDATRFRVFIGEGAAGGKTLEQQE